MALSDPRSAFGIHAIVMYRRSNYIPYGAVRVLGGGEISLEGDRVSKMARWIGDDSFAGSKNGER